MKVWELIAWLKEQDQMAEIEVCTDPESGKYAPFDADNMVVHEDTRKIIIFNF